MFKSCLLLGLYVGYCIELITWWSFIEHMVVNIDTCKSTLGRTWVIFLYLVCSLYINLSNMHTNVIDKNNKYQFIFHNSQNYLKRFVMDLTGRSENK